MVINFNKGLIFNLEIILALSLLSIVFLYITTMDFDTGLSYRNYERINLISKDFIEVLSELRVNDLIEMNNPTIMELYNQGIISDYHLNRNLLEAIGYFYSQNDLETANLISQSVLNEIIPPGLKYSLEIDETRISGDEGQYGNDFKYKSVTNRLISGFQSGEIIEGSVSRASLEKIKSKRTSSYKYFGGFIGEGNITVFIEDIPNDTEIKEIYIESNLGSDIGLLVNGNSCGEFEKSDGELSVDVFSITDVSCIENIIPGQSNYFNFTFPNSNINESFLGGGFLRVDYETNQTSEIQKDSIKYYFPGIEGLINIYDSFYVPGSIESIEAKLHFLNEYTTFLRIGDQTIFSLEGTDSEQEILLSNSTFAEHLAYGYISEKTVPLRLGMNATITETKGLADVVLITDLSGSMNWRMDSRLSGVTRTCNDPLLLDSSTRRISLAKCLDKEFIEEVLDVPGNRIALIGYDGTGNCIKNSLDFTDQISIANNEVDSYSAAGSTCIACALNKAYEVLEQQSDENRRKFVVIMTDGQANTIPITEGTVSPCTSAPDPVYDPACGDSVSQIASQQSIDASCNLNQALNSTVYSIGFGPLISCDFSRETLQDMAYCGEGEFFVSSEPLELQEIYEEIAQKIVTQSYVRQIISFEEGNVNSTLYPDSYIEFKFDSESDPLEFREISIKVESDNFPGCDGSFYIPQQLEIDEMKTTSYSFDYWTDNVRIRNSNTGDWMDVFQLSDFGESYEKFGDPFIIQFDPDIISKGEENQIRITTGLSPTETNPTCSQNNKIIYSARLSAFTEFSPVLPEAEGNNVLIYYDKNHDGIQDGSIIVPIGEDISNPSVIEVGELEIENNAVHFALYQLLEILNFGNPTGSTDPSGSMSNPIDIEITDEISTNTVSIKNIPSLWGPLNFKVIIWL
ncbi:MAG: VWA domain-containing protein [Candidatus Aenigmarchaeota archaeon]|nr:VWA domain-containing protein [Candidatus Aenigmarchaeota archaeon]